MFIYIYIYVYIYIVHPIISHIYIYNIYIYQLSYISIPYKGYSAIAIGISGCPTGVYRGGGPRSQRLKNQGHGHGINEKCEENTRIFGKIVENHGKSWKMNDGK